MTPVVEARGLTKRYPGPVEALRGVDLRIEDGERVAIVGPSGSGKTTLLHVIGALDRPTEGTIRVAGGEVGALSDPEVSSIRGTYLGFVFQQFFLLEGFSAVENVAQALVYRGVAPVDRRVSAEEVLGRLGMGHRLHHRASDLSGGERQRVAIARAMVGDPRLILADEPTGNLDAENGARILELLGSLNAGGVAVVVVTHSEAVARAMDRRIEILDGRIRSDSGGP